MTDWDPLSAHDRAVEYAVSILAHPQHTRYERGYAFGVLVTAYVVKGTWDATATAIEVLFDAATHNSVRQGLRKGMEVLNARQDDQ